jgi:DNA-directed RNA polymerase beta' subunit
VAHKRELRRRLADLARALRVEDPETFALRFGTIIDGAPSSGQALHAAGPVRFLQELAQLLVPKKGRFRAVRDGE